VERDIGSGQGHRAEVATPGRGAEIGEGHRAEVATQGRGAGIGEGGGGYRDVTVPILSTLEMT